CERDNLYYIRSRNNPSRQVDIDFLLQVPPREKSHVPECLQKLVNHYKYDFGIGKQAFSGKMTGKKFLKAINRNKAGSCRHRAISFMDAFEKIRAELQSQGYPHAECRIVRNKCHDFVEVKLSNDQPWMRFDLGGYPTKEKIHEPHKPA